MPITLNLLAEDQAAEEMRRRDPVKRAAIIGGVLVGAMLIWSSSLQVQTLIARSGLNQVESQLTSRTNAYEHVLECQKKTTEIKQKLGALRQLATHRLLYGSLLNALQQTVVEDVQVIRFRCDQSYSFIDETRSKTNGDRIVPGRPATATEKIYLTINARDTGDNPGDQIARFKEAIVQHAYFQNLLGKTNEVRLSNLSAPQTGPDGRPFVFFTLECRLPDRTR